MTSAPAPAADRSASAPLVDSPLEGLMEWDSPFRHTFVPGSDWAPWLTTAKFPPSPGTTHGTTYGGLAAPTVRAPEPPPPDAGDAAYARYRRDYEDRLDAAYAEWKRSVFVSLLEPWVIDRLAAEAARRLAKPVADGHAPSG